jgi:nudix-type nucleoside diphosphatase (YffH/AdpP family)
MQLISQQTVYEGWGRFLLLTVRLANGEEVRRQLEDHGCAAGVLPYDPQRRLALIARLPRAGPLYLGEEPQIMEAAAGIIEPGESPEVCIRREALEELGVRLDALEFVARAFTAPGASSEAISIYLAPYGAADRVALGGGAEGENEQIEVLELPLAELARQADAGEVRDLKTLALIMTLRVRRPDLFDVG